MSISAAHAGQYDLGRVSSPKTSYPKATQRLSLFSLELPLPPMRVFAVGVEHALDVAVQRPQDADPRVHQGVAAFSATDQAVDRVRRSGFIGGNCR
jgi:hypothetical protein